VIHDRRNRTFLSIRDQNNFRKEYRQKRLMTLMNVFLIHRYKPVSVHYVTPTEDNLRQAEGTKALGIYSQVNTEVGDIIVATVNTRQMKSLMNSGGVALKKLITKEG
jgi:isocitrate lyase